MDKSQTPNVVRAAPGTGYHRVKGNRRASRNGPRERSPGIPKAARFATFGIAVVHLRSRPRQLVRLGSVRRHPATPRLPRRLAQSDEIVANRDFRGFGWGSAHGAVTRRPPISLNTMVLRTGGYAYDVGVWDLSVIQGPFPAAPCQTLTLRFATCASLHLGRLLHRAARGRLPAPLSRPRPGQRLHVLRLVLLLLLLPRAFHRRLPPHARRPLNHSRHCSAYGDEKVATRNGGLFGSAHAADPRRRFLADFPLHDCSSCRGQHVRPESLGFVHRSRTSFCRAVPNPDCTIRFSTLYSEVQALGLATTSDWSRIRISA
jgi:hypothetical protein